MTTRLDPHARCACCGNQVEDCQFGGSPETPETKAAYRRGAAAVKKWTAQAMEQAANADTIRIRDRIAEIGSRLPVVHREAWSSGIGLEAKALADLKARQPALEAEEKALKKELNSLIQARTEDDARRRLEVPALMAAAQISRDQAWEAAQAVKKVKAATKSAKDAAKAEKTLAKGLAPLLTLLPPGEHTECSYGYHHHIATRGACHEQVFGGGLWTTRWTAVQDDEVGWVILRNQDWCICTQAQAQALRDRFAREVAAVESRAKGEQP